MIRIAFHVKEQVPGVWFGKTSEPTSFGGGDQFDFVFARRVLVKLQSGLSTQALEDFWVHIRNVRCRRRFGERGQRRDAAAAQFVDVRSLHIGDEAEMIVVLPLLIATFLPVTGRAMAARLRVGIGWRRRSEMFQPAPGRAGCRRQSPERGRAPAYRYLRRYAFDPAATLARTQQVRIHADLDDVLRLRPVGQFGIEYFVAKRPQR